MMQALAKVINRNLKDLEAAGCKYAQIDEPLFAIASDEEVQAAVDAINLALAFFLLSQYDRQQHT